MKIAFNKICIDPYEPVKQAGFIQQINPVFTIHDHLYASIIGLEDNNKRIILCSLDNLGIKKGLQLQQRLEKNVNFKNTSVVISCTHDHFAPDSNNENYLEYIYKLLLKAINQLIWNDIQLNISHQYIEYDGVGQSRISNHRANVYLDLFSLYDSSKRLASIIVYNCHPTILSGDTPYFSSEYPGYVIERLKESYPDEFFMFYQGAAGDVSTRFTRTTQDYNGVIQLGNKLYEQIKYLLNQDVESISCSCFNYESFDFELENEIKPIKIENIESLTPREQETIRVGNLMRQRYLDNGYVPDSSITISKLTLGPYKLIFTPKETFSSYLNALNKETSVLICYSNGYSPYIVDIDFKGITYELFTDTTTENTKIKYYNFLKEIDNK